MHLWHFSAKLIIPQKMKLLCLYFPPNFHHSRLHEGKLYILKQTTIAGGQVITVCTQSSTFAVQSHIVDWTQRGLQHHF